MSPRGVAITGVRERLFEAAERVLSREGPGGLTSRAVTSEAGCAKGLLHNHFEDLDDFVAQLVLHRFRQLAEGAATLPARAGERTVAENLTDAALALLGSSGPAITALALARPTATARIRGAWQQGAPGLNAIETSIAAYLQAEQRLGRVPGSEDCAALALAVVATAHHLLMTAWPDGPDPRERLRHLVTSLTTRTDDGPTP
ncbi:TetR/AcrR family transcriptional regulator [Streptomyces sp. NPDC053048]|uniref:TetR/AcrR family transcriptional regulator n=1 Tax=Streptomyces sp. NPDC053048 TaxID=3365694 RepID=UPI0037D2268F